MGNFGRSALYSDISSNVYTNIQGLIKGNTVKQRLLNLGESCVNRTDDANTANGYMFIDVNGRADASFIKTADPTGKTLLDSGVWGHDATKLDANDVITGATKTKVTYDSKGLVTSGTDATTADIADSTNKRYVTDAEKTLLGNTSGTNTGDETNGTILSKIGYTPENTANKATDFSTINNTKFPTVQATETRINLAIANLINSAPGALDTLDELAAALGDDANFASTVTNALALKAPLASPTFTGVPVAPTAAPGTNTTQIASTAFVTAAVAAIPSLFTDAGSYTYLTSTTDRFTVGVAADLGAKFGVQGSGATSATKTVVFHNSTGTSYSMVVLDNGNTILGAATSPDAYSLFVMTDSGAGAHNGIGVGDVTGANQVHMNAVTGSGYLDIGGAGGVGVLKFHGATGFTNFFNNAGPLLIGSATLNTYSHKLVLKSDATYSSCGLYGESGGFKGSIGFIDSGSWLELYNATTSDFYLNTRGRSYMCGTATYTMNIGTTTDMGFQLGVTGTFGVSGQVTFSGIPVGNSGRTTGQLYADTAANALANGDKILIIKS